MEKNKLKDLRHVLNTCFTDSTLKFKQILLLERDVTILYIEALVNDTTDNKNSLKLFKYDSEISKISEIPRAKKKGDKMATGKPTDDMPSTYLSMAYASLLDDILENHAKDNKDSLIHISTKSWHYRYMKWMLNNMAPDVSTMKNLCPYFWMLIFTLFITPFTVPFIAIFKGISKFGNLISDKIYDKIKVPATRSWFNNLTGQEILDLWDTYYINVSIETLDILGVNSDRELCAKWFEEKFPKSAYKVKDKDKGELRVSDEFLDYIKNQRNERLKIVEKKKQERIEKSSNNDLQNIKKTSDSINDFIDKIIDKIKNQKVIIKVTKKIVGALVTLTLGAGMFIIVNLLTKLLLLIIYNWTPYTTTVVAALFIIIIATIVVVFISNIIKKVLSNLPKANFDSGVFLPFKYIYKIFKFIIYDFLIKMILLKLFNVLLPITIITWRSTIGFFGIFKDYFKASYSDYCPGIKWDIED